MGPPYHSTYENTLNTKQDSESILKNLPNLLTQLNMDVWGKGDENDKTYALGEFVLYGEKLLPADDPQVEGLGLEPLGADDLLMQIQMQLSGRKSTTTFETLRKQVKTGLLPKKASPAKTAAASKNNKGKVSKDGSSSKKPQDAAAVKVLAEAAADMEPSKVKIEAPKEPLWT